MLIFFRKSQDTRLFNYRLWSVIKIFGEHKALYRNAHSQISQIFECSHQKVFLQKGVPDNQWPWKSELFSTLSAGVIAGTRIYSADNIPVVKYYLAQVKDGTVQIWDFLLGKEDVPGILQFCKLQFIINLSRNYQKNCFQKTLYLQEDRNELSWKSWSVL